MKEFRFITDPAGGIKVPFDLLVELNIATRISKRSFWAPDSMWVCLDRYRDAPIFRKAYQKHFGLNPKLYSHHKAPIKKDQQ